MENPEEVLQALDEFQKMKPSEIPRELEDYLCFVAKTGDPVYQWSLIKPLFREKLVRVMTDFYESCPTLDLTPSPNIEQFNYDSMKGNLLDLLESFANAPFTVQRICELLTSPRKEYNRVDKFMRAIEKNILVVSTREPGQAARRSENGDSMINGSIDDDTNNQQSHEIEMESWVKDCTTSDNVTLSTTDQDSSLVDTVSSKLTKETDDCLSVIQDKQESRSEINFITQTHELSTSTTVQHEQLLCNAQNLGNVGDVGISGDVPEGIMNEDTSSQPSLDSENDESDSNNSRKLQTTFQSKDFVKETKSNKFYSEEPKADEKISENESENENSDNDSAKVESEKRYNENHQHPDLSIDDPVLEKRPRLDDDVSESDETKTEVNSAETKEESEPEAKEEAENSTIDREIPDFAKTDDVSKDVDDSKEENEEEIPISEGQKPIVEEPETENVPEAKPEEVNVVIQEAMDDDVKTISSIVPDPIPIIEEPKDDGAEAIVDPEIAELIDAKSPNIEKSEESPVEELCEPIVEAETIVQINENIEKIEPESMEIDSEESAFPQDEPMEEESGDQLKS